MRSERPRTSYRLLACGSFFLIALSGAPALADAQAVSSSSEGASEGGAHIRLTQGYTYRARFNLGFFQCKLGSRSTLENRLRDRGFTGVRIYMGENELPPDWPAELRSKVGHCPRYAEGTWVRPTADVKRPKLIESLWVAALPVAEASPP